MNPRLSLKDVQNLTMNLFAHHEFPSAEEVYAVIPTCGIHPARLWDKFAARVRGGSDSENRRKFFSLVMKTANLGSEYGSYLVMPRKPTLDEHNMSKWWKPV